MGLDTRGRVHLRPHCWSPVSSQRRDLLHSVGPVSGGTESPSPSGEWFLQADQEGIWGRAPVVLRAQPLGMRRAWEGPGGGLPPGAFRLLITFPHMSWMLAIIVQTRKYLVVFFFKCLFIFRDTKCEWGRGRERGRHRTPKQAPGSELSAQSPPWGSNQRTVRS